MLLSWVKITALELLELVLMNNLQSNSISMKALLASVGVAAEGICLQTNISDLFIDSRECNKQGIFLAIKGEKLDGRNYISAAIKQGVIAVFKDADSESEHGEITNCSHTGVVIVAIWQLKKQQAVLAHTLWGESIADLVLCGITGTNGKTSVAEIIYQALEQFGDSVSKPAYIGTLGIKSGTYSQANPNTTPVAISLYRQLAHFKNMGVSHCVLEVSSHAIAEGRIAGLNFATVAFTNLSHDHLDFHGNMDSYFSEKTRLFSDYSSQCKVINTTESWGEKLAANCLEHKFGPVQTINCQLSLEADKNDFQLLKSTLDQNGCRIEFSCLVNGEKTELTLKSALIGHFNIENLLLAFACLKTLNLDVNQIQKALSDVTSIPGRMEAFSNKKADSALVIVDFAHTPDGLEKALAAAQVHTQNRLWLVFGCGGDRDKDKRALMGEIALKYADRVIITNDNPRCEAPEDIAKDIMLGIADKQKVELVLDRKQAILKALQQSTNNDIVLIAGKGHETYQDIQGVKYPYDERYYVSQLMENAA